MCLKRYKPQLIFVTGLPGSGKTYHIQHNVTLKDLPQIDIRAVYEKHPEWNGDIDSWMKAQDEFIKQALKLSRRMRSPVVCEAILLRNTPSRIRLSMLLVRKGITHSWDELYVSYEKCMERVRADYERVLRMRPSTKERVRAELYYTKRVDILNSYRLKGLI